MFSELADSKQRIRDLNNRVEIYESLILQKPSVEVAQSLQCILQWSPYNRNHERTCPEPFAPVADSSHQNQNSLKNGLERVVGTSVLDSLRLSLAADDHVSHQSRPQRGQCTLAISNQTTKKKKKRRSYHQSHPGRILHETQVFIVLALRTKNKQLEHHHHHYTSFLHMRLDKRDGITTSTSQEDLPKEMSRFFTIWYVLGIRDKKNNFFLCWHFKLE